MPDGRRLVTMSKIFRDRELNGAVFEDVALTERTRRNPETKG